MTETIKSMKNNRLGLVWCNYHLDLYYLRSILLYLKSLYCTPLPAVFCLPACPPARLPPQNESCGGFDAFDLYYLQDVLDECQGIQVSLYEQVRGGRLQREHVTARYLYKMVAPAVKNTFCASTIWYNTSVFYKSSVFSVPSDFSFSHPQQQKQQLRQYHQRHRLRQQCGGNDEYDGSTCCTEGYECVALAACYPQVRTRTPNVIRCLMFES